MPTTTRLSEEEQAIARAVAEQWRVGNLWHLPEDETAVRDAIAFAYMMADKVAPKEIIQVRGPTEGEREASKRGASFEWHGLGGGRRFGVFELSWALREVGHVHERLVRGMQDSFFSLARFDADAVHRILGHENGTFSVDLRTSAFADFLVQTNLLSEAGDYEARKRLLFACGPFWWANDDVFLYTRPPTILHLDGAKRLHHEAHEAIAWDDGTRQCAWHGRLVDRGVLEGRHALTPPMILAEPNADVRRVKLEMFGLDRFVRELGGRLVHEDEFGKLWEVDLPGDHRPAKFVEVVNATPEPDGTRRVYFLRVWPFVSTAHDAVAWTFGLSASQYRPARES